MVDPTQAMVWLLVASVVVLLLCFGGALVAAGLGRSPAPGPDRGGDPGAELAAGPPSATAV